MKPLNLLLIIKQQNITCKVCSTLKPNLLLFGTKRFDYYQQLRQQREGS